MKHTSIIDSTKKDFFVSYSSSDEKWAEWIAFQLEDNGYTTILQAWDWGPGSNFILEMQKAAKECERTILVLSPSFLDSDYTQPEWAQAFRRDPKGERRLLIPVRVQKCELEGFFGPLVYIDFLKEKPPEVAGLRDHLIKLLLDGVKLGRKKPQTEPPIPRFSTADKGDSGLTRDPWVEAKNSSLDSEESANDRTDVIFGVSRKDVLSRLERDWLRSRKVVAILQGFPGTGKNTLALSIVLSGWIFLDPIQVGLERENRETDLLMDLATSLESHGFDELAKELAKGELAEPFSALGRLIRRERIVITIDEFQRFFPKDDTSPPDDWQRLIEGLNNAPAASGKLLIISNRIVSSDRWNEGCIEASLKGLTDAEAASFLLECLSKRGLVDRIPAKRLIEIGRRLGGNPRAIKTLVGSLVYSSIEELFSAMPEPLETGDVQIEQEILEKFERGLISRAIDFLESDEVLFMRWLAVNRLPVARAAYAGIEKRFPESKRLRINLINRFLLEAGGAGDVMHPLAREIAVTRLREDEQEWKLAHSIAADQQLELFTSMAKSGGRPRAASFVELRHHLFESGRLAELSNVSERMRAFVLSRIRKQTHSKIPRTTEILEEHIVLIQSLTEEKRTKGLDYHLALCLKERDGTGDYPIALEHARKAVGPQAYYAVWLLLADLEFCLNGVEALKRVAGRALANLGSGSNAFAIYHHCADLLDKGGQTAEAVSFLEQGIRTPGVECKASLIALCARFLEQMGDREKATELLAREMKDGTLKEAGIVFANGASMLIRNGQAEKALQLLDQGIEQREMTKLFSLYLLKADAFVALSMVEDAMNTLREGINDKRVIDPVELFRELARLMAMQGDVDGAVALLQSAAKRRSIRRLDLLFHAIAKILEDAGEFDLGARLLGAAIETPELRYDHTIYLACSKMHFRAQNLERASAVLEKGLRESRLMERNQLLIKLAEISYRRGQHEAAIKILREAIDKGRDPRHLGKIYQYCSELLEATEGIKAAEEVLRQGIDAPAIADKSVLVQSLAKNLAKQQRPEEAVRILRDALKWPGISGVVILYQACAKILASAGKTDDAIEILREGMANKSIGNLGSLYTRCAELLASSGKYAEATELLTKGISEFPKDQSLKDLQSRLNQRRNSGGPKR